jgi:hypothetical protein
MLSETKKDLGRSAYKISLLKARYSRVISLSKIDSYTSL